jgi:hypothetical protein
MNVLDQWLVPEAVPGAGPEPGFTASQNFGGVLCLRFFRTFSFSVLMQNTSNSETLYTLICSTDNLIMIITGHSRNNSASSSCSNEVFERVLLLGKACAPETCLRASALHLI